MGGSNQRARGGLRRQHTTDSVAHARPDLPVRMVASTAELDALLGALQSTAPIAFDTEFHSERTYVPQLMLLQVATAEAIWLADPLAVDLRPLVAALCAPDRLIIGHALRNDLKILWQVYGKVPPRVFDTQVAAAFLGHGLQAGLAYLLQQVLNVHLPKGEQMANWGQRPLPDKLVCYAAGDVAHLHELQRTLTGQLHHRGRLPWVEQECAALIDPAAYDRDPTTAGDRVAGARRLEPREAGVLYAAAALRERLAQQEDLIPHFLVPDEMLLALAKAQPRALKDLQQDRRLQQRAIQRYGAQWVDAVATGLQTPVRRQPGRPPPPPEVEAVAGLAMLLIGELAARHGVAQPLLAKREAIVDALRERPQSRQQLAELLGLQGWRCDLLLEPLWQFLQGGVHVRCQADDAVGVRLNFGDLEPL